MLAQSLSVGPMRPASRLLRPTQHGSNIAQALSMRPVTRISSKAASRRLRQQRRELQPLRATDITPSVAEVTGKPAEAAKEQAAAGDTTAVASTSNGAKAPEGLPEGRLVFKPASGSSQWWTSFRLAFALPWRRVKQGSVLTFKMEGDISDQSRSWLDSGTSMPQLCTALRNAAHDPRISGVCIEIAPLSAGWAKIQEIRRHLEYFRSSGKYSIAFMKTGGEKEYYLASACGEIYVPPTGNLSLRGFAVSGTFLRGVLDKVGVEPQIERIGKFKSAGDQILRRDMSEAQHQQLEELLQDINTDFLTTVAAARNKTPEEVKAMLDEGIFEMEKFVEQGYLTALKYEDELIDDLKARTGGKADQVRKVGLKRYARVPPAALGFRGKKVIAVLRSAGAIIGGKGTNTGGQITPDSLIPQLRALAKNKNVAAVVLRVDSPGGDALASDLMWREIQQLAKKKPVIASMGDVAASGGYYLSMAASKIVAEPLTITGSIGVVTGKFNLAELFEKVGYNKTILSKGRYAELLADSRPFTVEEKGLFERSAQHAYRSFRDRAAASRGMSVEAMQEVAQGRVWSGVRALQAGLVDAVGGVHRAIAIAKQAANIPQDENVTVLELGRAKSSPLQLLTGGASAMAPAAMLTAAGEIGSPALQRAVVAVAPLLAGLAGQGSGAALLQFMKPGQISYLLTDVDVGNLGSSSSASATGGVWESTSSPSDSSNFLASESDQEDEGIAEAVVGQLEEWLEGWAR